MAMACRFGQRFDARGQITPHQLSAAFIQAAFMVTLVYGTLATSMGSVASR
ncbi:MAG: hypothetical protein QOG67_2007 [Verrucomicrobiota bacterium]|jgi:hypothetical protein